MKCRNAQMTKGLLADPSDAVPIVTKSDAVMIYNLDPNDINIK